MIRGKKKCGRVKSKPHPSCTRIYIQSGMHKLANNFNAGEKRVTSMICIYAVAILKQEW